MQQINRREFLGAAAGSTVMPITRHWDIVHLGFVDDATKWNAMAAWDWLAMPSRHESLSMALLEVWAAGRSDSVNGRCDVLVGHCRKTHAGFWYFGFDEFRAILTIVDDGTKTTLGRQGSAYVQRHYSRELVEKKCRDLLEGPR